MISSAVLMTLVLPLQIASHSGGTGQFKPFFVTRSFVDCAQILGLPKFKLRDSSGNPYLPDKALLQEPLATVHENAGIIFLSEVNKRKAYILSYVKR
jgi:hypothetical protein